MKPYVNVDLRNIVLYSAKLVLIVINKFYFYCQNVFLICIILYLLCISVISSLPHNYCIIILNIFHDKCHYQNDFSYLASILIWHPFRFCS